MKLYKADRQKLQLASKTITFTGASALGEADVAVPLFTVTGEVIIERIVPYCSTNLAGASATLILGVVGSTSLFLGATTATDIDAGKFWLDTDPAETSIAIPAACKDIAVTADIIATPATANITGGVLRFDVYWRPLSSDGLVVPA